MGVHYKARRAEGWRRVSFFAQPPQRPRFCTGHGVTQRAPALTAGPVHRGGAVERRDHVERGPLGPVALPRRERLCHHRAECPRRAQSALTPAVAARQLPALDTYPRASPPAPRRRRRRRRAPRTRGCRSAPRPPTVSARARFADACCHLRCGEEERHARAPVPSAGGLTEACKDTFFGSLRLTVWHASLPPPSRGVFLLPPHLGAPLTRPAPGCLQGQGRPRPPLPTAALLGHERTGCTRGARGKGSDHCCSLLLCATDAPTEHEAAPRWQVGGGPWYSPWEGRAEAAEPFRSLVARAPAHLHVPPLAVLRRRRLLHLTLCLRDQQPAETDGRASPTLRPRRSCRWPQASTCCRPSSSRQGTDGRHSDLRDERAAEPPSSGLQRRDGSSGRSRVSMGRFGGTGGAARSCAGRAPEWKLSVTSSPMFGERGAWQPRLRL